MMNFVRVALTSFLMAGSGPALGIDIEPGDYTNLPASTNAIALYYQRIESKSFSLDGGDVAGSKLVADVFVARYLKYLERDGKPFGYQVILPFGSFSEATVGSSDIEVSNGVGDLTVGGFFWLLSADQNDATGTTLGFTLYGSLPTGDYSLGGANIGKGGATVTPQIGLIQGLGSGYFFDASYDVSFTNDFSSNGVDVSVGPQHQAQIWLRRELSSMTNVAIGYSGIRGGEISANSVNTGVGQTSDQIRLSVGRFLNPTTQISGRISYDFNRDDGFKSEPLFQIRLVKFF